MVSSSSAAARKLVGRRVGPYVIQGLIAQGGMGAVYEAEHERLHRRVALKTLLAGTSASNEDVQRFLNEARAAASLSHPNLVPIYDVGEAQGIRYLAMELVRGRSLYERLRSEGPMEEEHAVRLISQAADGLEQAHELGILHRDLKPANILLQESDGQPRITDFGVAKAPGNQRLTATGTALGTPQYMSPEQAMGKNDSLDARSDVYGLGAILYECLTGMPPFTRSSEMETMQAVVNEPVDPPTTHRKITPEAEAIVLRCLAKRPENRYASARALAEDAERYLRGERPLALTESPDTGVGLSGVKRNMLLVAVVLACTLVGVMLTLVLTLPSLLADRRSGKVEEAAATKLEERLSAAEAALGRSDRAAWRAALDGLAWERSREEVLEALGGDEEGKAAAARGLGDPAAFRRRADPLRASLALKLAGSETPQPGSEEVAHLIAAAVHAPESEAGRAARLRLARSLVGLGSLEARRVAREELSGLVDPGSAAGVEALIERARVRAAGRDFDGAAGDLKAALGAATLPASERRGAAELSALCEALSGRQDLPPHRAAFGRDKLGPLLLSYAGHRVELRRPQEDGSWGEARRTWDLTPKHVEAVAVGDRDGDGRAEGLVVLREPGRSYFGVLDLAATGREAFRPVLMSRGQSQGIRCLATGDVDGDKRTDVALIFADLCTQSYVVLGRGRNPILKLFQPAQGPPRYGVAAAVMADVDGDGKDEVVVGSSPRGPGLVDVRGLDANGGSFRSLGSVRVGAVRRLRKVRRAEQPDLIVAAVDYARGEDLPQEREGKPAWFGRDGLYLVGRGADQKLGLLGRWTFGPDELPTADTLGLGSSVDGWPLQLGDTLCLVRSSLELGAGRWRLEVCPLSEVQGGSSPSPRLTLRCDLPGTSVGRVEPVDVDGDGELEVLSGDALLGLRQAASQPAARARPLGPARRLSLAAAQARLLGRSQEAEGYRGRLQEAFPGLAAAGREDLDRIDALLLAADRAERAAGVALERGALEVGRARAAAALQRFAEAGELADRCAAEEGLGARESALASGKASFAWRRAGDPARALAALRRVLARPDLGPDWRDRFREDLGSLAAEAALQRVAVDLRTNGARTQLGVTRPLRTRLGAEGVEILCGARSADAAGLGVDLSAGRLPLIVEAELDLQGTASEATVKVGLMATVLGFVRSGTGFEVALSSERSRLVPSCQPIVAGRPVGAPFSLPSYLGRYTLRLELRTRSGVLELLVSAFDRERKLLHRDRRETSLRFTAPRGARVLGISSPLLRSRDNTTGFSSSTALESWVRLRRIAVAAPEVALKPITNRTWNLHRTLLYGRPQDASREYTQLLARPNLRSYHDDALWGRALARARAGDPRAHEDLVAAARRFPYRTTLLLEDAIGPVLDGNDPRELQLIGAALRALRADPEPIPQLIGRQLLGEVNVGINPAQDMSRAQQATVCYLSFRLPGRERWRWLPQYRKVMPSGRIPKWRYPPMLPVLTKLSEEAYAALLQGRGFTGKRYQALMRAIAARPRQAFPRIALAQMYVDAKLPGLAEQELRRALERAQGKLQHTTILQRLVVVTQQLHARQQLFDVLRGLKKRGYPADQIREAVGSSLRDDPRFEAVLQK